MGRKHKLGIKVLMVTLGVLLILLPFAGCAPTPEEGVKKTIRMAATPWCTTPPLNSIAKILLEEEMGYEVELVHSTMDVAWAAVANGDIDVIMDAWVLNYPEKLITLGDKIAIIGLNYGEAVQGWFVPEAYTPPELTSVGQLNNYIELFDDDGDGRGEIYGVEPGCGGNRINQLMIDRLDLNYYQVESSEWAMLSMLAKACESEKPILVYLWTPHWAFSKHDLRYLEDPSGSFPKSIVMTIVNKEFLTREPDVCLFFNRFETTVEEMNQAIYEAEVKEREPMEIAREWIRENRSRVDSWLEIE